VGGGTALLLAGGVKRCPVSHRQEKFYLLPLIASVIAAAANYHRPLFSWSGLPGAVTAYFGYIAGAILLRSRWRINPQLTTMRDVARYLIVMFSGAIWSALVGTTALTADGLADRPHFLKNLTDWWASDAIALVTFAPLLLVHIMWRVDSLFGGEEEKPGSNDRETGFSPWRTVEHLAQVGTIAVIVWVLFGFAPAVAYQPLYLLFIPVIWMAVRHAMDGATLAASFLRRRGRGRWAPVFAMVMACLAMVRRLREARTGRGGS
jgi:integral membrane sensor domain MASE1